MKIGEMNWSQVEQYLKTDDRAVLPLGSTEQHAGLSLSVDSILSERVALEAAEPLGVPVFPVLAYGITPYFLAYPGTVSLRVETYVRIVRDILDSLKRAGFRKIADRQRPRRQPAGAEPGDRVDGRQSGLRRSNSTIGGTRRRPSPRCRRSIPSRRMRRGWRIFPGRG